MKESGEAVDSATGRAPYLQWAETAFSAAIMALLAALFSVLYAAFIFSGPLLDFVKPSYQVFLLGAAVMMAITCYYSQFRGIYALLQDEAVVILAAVAAGVSHGASAMAGAGVYPTILTIIAVSTIFTGGFFYLLGAFRFGKIIRYVPFSVTAGFMITIGWLLVHGGLGVGLGMDLEPGSLHMLAEPGNFVLLIATVGFACAVEFISRRVREVFALPLVLTAGMVLFHLVALLSSYSYPELAAVGWLLPEGKDNAHAVNSFWNGLGDVDWNVVASQWRAYISVALVSALALLLAVTGLELSSQQQVDVDIELRASGVANLVSGLTGGGAGYPDIGVTTMMYQSGAANNKSVFIAAGICLGLVFFGGSWLGYVPVPFLGGVFLWLGWQLWREWLFNHGDYLQTEDWIAVAAIVVVTIYFGFIAGVLLGVGVGVSLFLIDYSQVQSVQYVING
ncbi:MAG: SulP family sulfate permease, partial [Halieaceae bacterium]